MATNLTDTMKQALGRLARGEMINAGAGTVKALKSRGLITENTQPRDGHGWRNLYMLTEAGRNAARTDTKVHEHTETDEPIPTEAAEATRVNDHPTARTAADLPKGTRVSGPDGRLGTTLGCWTGRITNKNHPNYGREYTGVEWDADTKYPWGERSRPLVDELTIVAGTAEATASPETDDYVPSRDAALAAARIALSELKTSGWKANPEYWVGRLESALKMLVDTDSQSESGSAEDAACGGESDCASHDIKDERAARALELGAIPACESGVTYGAWSEGAGGFVYSGDCATEVANWAADELRKLAKDDDTDKLAILAMCPDHDEQPKDGCEERYIEPADGDEGDMPTTTITHKSGLTFRVIPSRSYDARMARDVRRLTMADGTVWTVGTRGRGSCFAWR